jgi:hypothetical protein
MNSALSVKHTRCRQGLALAVVDGLPGGHAELRPSELVALGLALLFIARDCERASAREMETRQKYPLIPLGRVEP